MQPVSPEEEQSILVIGDERELTEDVCSQLAQGTYKVAVVYGVEEALKSIEAGIPDILVFASASIVDTERIYLEILRKAVEFQAISHYTIVTCKGTEVEIAYDLCKRNVFDDYVVVRPLYDRHRLSIAVQQAIRLRMGMEQLAEVSHSIGSAGIKIDEFSLALEQHLARANRLNEAVRDNVGRTRERLAGRLADIGTQFYHGIGSQASPRSIEEARRKFQEVASTAIQPELSSAFEETASVFETWTESFEKDLHRGREAIKTIVDQAAELRAPVMVVDDDPVYSEVVMATLEESGFRVQGAGSITQALQAFSKESYCSAMIDFELPDGNGIELISQLKSLDKYKNLPIILMTGHSVREVVEDARAKGVQHFIVKPAQRDTVIKKLHDALKGSL